MLLAAISWLIESPKRATINAELTRLMISEARAQNSITFGWCLPIRKPSSAASVAEKAIMPSKVEASA
ncbi:hypothetical protein GCM10009422_19350 [Brevundimonas kwangchunensis]|uniref:Transposase n=1 Tax=Brevundimonas kwangchunensis TaxID=322163 RepID=A0ABN1GY82_9CAUL